MMNNGMNEKFRKLYDQAASLAQQNAEINSNYEGSDLQEFAELIVQECARSLWTEECHTSDLALEEFNRNSKKIKQHFGV